MLTPDFTFIHACTVRPWLKQGIDGPEYGAPVTYRCRVELGRKKVTSQGGAVQEVIATGTIFFPRGTRFLPESEITYDGLVFTALSVEPRFGFSETYVEVMIL